MGASERSYECCHAATSACPAIAAGWPRRARSRSKAALDRGYGQGTRQLPMTAVGGDLALVGQLAAKVTVATILERAGHPEQRLPGEHATIGLRPSQDLPRPFDAGLGEVHWVEGHPPQPHCITCRWS